MGSIYRFLLCKYKSIGGSLLEIKDRSSECRIRHTTIISVKGRRWGLFACGLHWSCTV